MTKRVPPPGARGNDKSAGQICEKHICNNKGRPTINQIAPKYIIPSYQVSKNC